MVFIELPPSPLHETLPTLYLRSQPDILHLFQIDSDCG